MFCLVCRTCSATKRFRSEPKTPPGWARSEIFPRPGSLLKSVIPYTQYLSEMTSAMQIVCKRWNRHLCPKLLLMSGNRPERILAGSRSSCASQSLSIGLSKVYKALLRQAFLYSCVKSSAQKTLHWRRPAAFAAGLGCLPNLTLGAFSTISSGRRASVSGLGTRQGSPWARKLP